VISRLRARWFKAWLAPVLPGGALSHLESGARPDIFRAEIDGEQYRIAVSAVPENL
jgi:hypothetical protein